MHLLATKPGRIETDQGAVDLAQTPAPLVMLSAADTDLTLWASAQRHIHRSNPDAPALRLASLADLTHPLSVDLYISTICAKARLVVVRLLGGTS
ncbi:MAG: hypothetical protein AAF418_03880, partial [Pseudomonadota bacterium]